LALAMRVHEFWRKHLDNVMGKSNGPYKEEFSKGSTVKIADRTFLGEFLRTWKSHHQLEVAQLEFAENIAKVKSVSFYPGGDELYA
jgi:hypothetical protein